MSGQKEHRRKNVCDEIERLPEGKYENNTDKQKVTTAGMKQTNGKKGEKGESRRRKRVTNYECGV
ncbi:MAG: hypothetical protein PHZ02_15165 [Desulfocapsaceae bacterium]|nr:hypothetical protein [Desulfocapsaceae bacterium]